MMTYGGKHKLSFEQYHAVPAGWDAASIVSAHAHLKGTFDIRPVQIAETGNQWLKYRQTLYNIAQGVSSDDVACVELAISFIELQIIGSYAGFIRSLLARRLKHASLTGKQRERLSRHFLDLLRRGEHCHEFRDYLGLWRSLASPIDIAQVEQLAQEAAQGQPRFLLQVLVKLRRGRTFPAASRHAPETGP